MDFLQELVTHKVYIDYHNGNPEITNTAFGDFTHKPYFDILIDDKAGFNGKTDWELIYKELHETHT